MIPKVDMDTKLFTLLEKAGEFLEQVRLKNNVDDSDAKLAESLYMELVCVKLGAAAQIARYKGDWVAAKSAFDLATATATMLDKFIQQLEAQEVIRELIQNKDIDLTSPILDKPLKKGPIN